ncbi:hypothetical protein N8616_03105 [Verrucomicrobia bacterium]|nr:hypothetical protein [Verrucomicrobiota bacterium]MDA7533333.1 hypothetical protein [Verrucomicrobiota bacterium]MDA7665577.1 hypothetical protein [Verrucomicrobiota bacterium]
MKSQTLFPLLAVLILDGCGETLGSLIELNLEPQRRQVIKQLQSQAKTKQISTFREIRSLLGLLLFVSALLLAGSRLRYNWAEEIPAMDPEGFGA